MAYEHEREEPLALPAFLGDPLGVIRRRWRWMAPVLVIGVAAATFLVTRLIHREYSASSRVLVSSARISEDFVRSTIQEDPLEKMNALVGEILARDALAEMVEAHELYPNLQGLDESQLLNLMRSKISIALDDQMTDLRRREESAHVFRMSFIDDNPRKAALVANDLAVRFMDASIEMRTRQARITTQFLRQELEETEAELSEQNTLLTGLLQQNRGSLPAELDSNLSRLERLQSQRANLALQITEAETRVVALAQGGTATRADDLSPRARLAQLRARLAEQQAVYTDEHPNVTSLQRQIQLLESDLAANPNLGAQMSLTPTELLVASRRTIDELRSQLAYTDEQIAGLEAAVEATPEAQQELQSVEQRVNVLRDKYVDFQRKVQEAELAESLEAAQQGQRVAIIDRASPPRMPMRSRARWMAAGIIASFLGALLVGVLLEFFDPVVLTPEQIESRFELSTIGSAPPMAG